LERRRRNQQEEELLLRLRVFLRAAVDALCRDFKVFVDPVVDNDSGGCSDYYEVIVGEAGNLLHL
jgi:hypothetical protein